MGLLNDLGRARKKQSSIEQNTETLRNSLEHELSRDDLADLIRLMREPDVHEAVFANAKAFGEQPQMDDTLRSQFSLHTADILSAHPERLRNVIGRFEGKDVANDRDETLRVSDRMVFSNGKREKSLGSDIRQKITGRIQATRQDLNDRLDYQANKVKQSSKKVSNALERRIGPLVGMAQNSMSDMLNKVKNRVQSVKDDYRTRQLAIDNARNWETALDKGVTSDQIRNVINHSSYPEVRYGVMKHATKLFEQDSMTPELATDLLDAYHQYTDPNNAEHERFYNQLEAYANSVVDETFESTASAAQVHEASNLMVETEPSETDKASATTTLMSYTLAKNGQPSDVPSDVRDKLDEHLSFAGYNKDGENIWVQKSEDDLDVLIGDEEAEGVAMAVYTYAMTERLTNKPSVDVEHDTNTQPTRDEPLKPQHMQYGDENTLKFKDSRTYTRLMEEHGFDTLPNVQLSTFEMDVRRAELLGISKNGEAVWGVPDQGDICYLSDNQLEDAFREQYGRFVNQNDEPLPDMPPEEPDYSFYDQLSNSFNDEWDDENALMGVGESNQPDPVIPDDDDAPPLSFDGLDDAPVHTL